MITVVTTTILFLPRMRKSLKKKNARSSRKLPTLACLSSELSDSMKCQTVRVSRTDGDASPIRERKGGGRERDRPRDLPWDFIPSNSALARAISKME